MRIAVLSPSQANPTSETALAIQRAEMEVLDYSWDEPAEKLASADAYVLLADSDEDLVNSSVQSLNTLLQTQCARGKPILGLGYGGAKLLVDCGLVPGLFKNLLGLRLVERPPATADFTETWIRLSDDYQYNAFTRNLTPREFLPVHLTTQAQFIIPPGLLAEIKAQGLNVFLYCDSEGKPLPGPNLAALSNKAGNVMALPSHPEITPAGDAIFQSLRTHLASGYIEQIEPLYYWPRK